MRRTIVAMMSVAFLLSPVLQSPSFASHAGTNGKIAFDIFFGTKIQTIEPDGSGRSTLATGTRGVRDPAWSPDGTQLAYISGQHTLVVVNADGSSPHIVASPTTRLSWAISPSWSADSSQIAVLAQRKGAGPSGNGTSGRVTIVDAATGALTQIGPHRATPFGGLDWSPTGSIAWIDDAGFKGNQLQIIQPDGSGLRSINGDYLFDPSWSPDGARIAVAHAIGKQRSDIMVMNADGTGRNTLTATMHRWEWTPSWSPDGTMIAFSRTITGSDQAPDDIWIMNADGSGAHALTDTPKLDEFGLDWQPLP